MKTKVFQNITNEEQMVVSVSGLSGGGGNECLVLWFHNLEKKVQ